MFNIIRNALDPQRPARMARKDILAKYGDPGLTYESLYCQKVNPSVHFPWFPYKGSILVNEEFWDHLFAAFYEIDQYPSITNSIGLKSEIKTYDGCLVIRNTRGSGLISLHAWGMAMDLNASIEGLGQTRTHWSPLFLSIMRKYVYWGGDFVGRKDPMHFSLYGE